ncbi:MAG: hypothetical protein C0478_04315 [Planctomyces sp.]|nr:hypothetical protein [Planctomyces sp.]
MLQSVSSAQPAPGMTQGWSLVSSESLKERACYHFDHRRFTMHMPKTLLATSLTLGLAAIANAQPPGVPQPANTAPPGRTTTTIQTPVGNVQVQSNTPPRNVPPRANGTVDPNRVNPQTGAYYTPGAQVQVGAGGVAVGARPMQQPAMNIESHIVNCLILKNQEEVELSKFAQNELQNEKVKQFAAQLAADHQQAVQKLQALKVTQTTQVEAANPATFVATEAVTAPVPGTPAQRRVERQADRQAERTERQIERVTGANVEVTPNTPAAQRQVVGYRGRVVLQPQYAGKTNEGDQFLQIQQDATQECLDLAVAELMEAKDNKQIDQCFLGIQAGMHMGMLAQLTALEKHTSGEVQQFVVEAKATTQKHLQLAKNLMQEVDQK